MGYDVLAISRRASSSLTDVGVACAELDLSDLQSNTTQAYLHQLFEGVDCVFHVAAKVGMWGDFYSFYQTNVQATRVLLKVAKVNKVKAFIYTSSPSVVASGKSLKGVNESVGYPEHYDAYYPMTKAMAEWSVLEANDCSSEQPFRTVALRPHLIWGPGDTNLLPTIIERARQGRLIRIGSGTNLVDFSYIDDCVQAHLRAMVTLLSTDTLAADAASGRAFFISQGEPTLLWGFIEEVLKRNRLMPLRRSLSHSTARILARLSESISSIRPSKEPLLTRFLVDEMATDHYFDISAATKLIGYRPVVSMADGMERTFPV
jgi:nucleoside-diphosphate-sugar epimerase